MVDVHLVERIMGQVASHVEAVLDDGALWAIPQKVACVLVDVGEVLLDCAVVEADAACLRQHLVTDDLKLRNLEDKPLQLLLDAMIGALGQTPAGMRRLAQGGVDERTEAHRGVSTAGLPGEVHQTVERAADLVLLELLVDPGDARRFLAAAGGDFIEDADGHDLGKIGGATVLALGVDGIDILHGALSAVAVDVAQIEGSAGHEALAIPIVGGRADALELLELGELRVGDSDLVVRHHVAEDGKLAHGRIELEPLLEHEAHEVALGRIEDRVAVSRPQIVHLPVDIADLIRRNAQVMKRLDGIQKLELAGFHGHGGVPSIATRSSREKTGGRGRA